MTTFLDTNVLIYLLDQQANFHQWSVSQFEKSKADGPVIISDIVYCEFCVGMNTQGAVDTAISQFGIERLRGNDAALFRAAMAFKDYRKNGGSKTNVLPDFLIGAIAEVAGSPLITANRKDFLGYFPQLQVISPEG